jgi:hypothetical protein
LDHARLETGMLLVVAALEEAVELAGEHFGLMGAEVSPTPQRSDSWRDGWCRRAWPHSWSMRPTVATTRRLRSHATSADPAVECCPDDDRGRFSVQKALEKRRDGGSDRQQRS